MISNQEELSNYNTKEIEELQNEMSKLLGNIQENENENENIDDSLQNLNSLQFDESELEKQINNVLNDESLQVDFIGLDTETNFDDLQQFEEDQGSLDQVDGEINAPSSSPTSTKEEIQETSNGGENEETNN